MVGKPLGFGRMHENKTYFVCFCFLKSKIKSFEIFFEFLKIF